MRWIQGLNSRADNRKGEAMAEKTIEIKNLTVEYRTRAGRVQALNGLSLSIEKGKTLGLV